MDPRLQQAIEHDDVDELYRFIVEEPKLLDRACKDPLPNTPLHVAAAAGKTQVAIEMAILKPSFARKLNPEGYSPLHLALQYEHYQTVRALMTFNPKLIRVRGRRGITPLLYLAEKEGDSEMELLAEFLTACKSSIEDLTSRCETALHVAVRNHNLKAFKVLFGWLKRVFLTKILDQKDQDGNTVLHIAAFEKQSEIIKLLIGYIRVEAKNFQDETALEIFQANSSGDQDIGKRLLRAKRIRRLFYPTRSLSQYFRSELSAIEKLNCFFGISIERFREILILAYFSMAAICFQESFTALERYWRHSSSNLPANSTVVTTNSSSTAIGNLTPNGWWLYFDVAFNISFFFFATIVAFILCVATQLPYVGTVYWWMFPFIVASYSCFRKIFPESIEAAGASFWNFTSTSG